MPDESAAAQDATIAISGSEIFQFCCDVRDLRLRLRKECWPAVPVRAARVRGNLESIVKSVS
jgi:hypothetical protein